MLNQLSVKKIFKWLFVSFTSLVFLVIVYFQYNAEKYLDESQYKYGVYKIERKSYLPYLFFEVRHRVKVRSDEYSKFIHLPYQELGLEDKYWINQSFARYYTYCFYNLEELESLDEKLNND